VAGAATRSTTTATACRTRSTAACPVQLDRVFARDGLPQGLTESEAPLLAHLGRLGVRYDLTTDVALAVRRGPQIEGHTGVLLAGDTVWLTSDVRRRLRTFAAQRGHTVVSLGTDSLRREVEQTPDALTRPARRSAPTCSACVSRRSATARST
jgi:hypothetical protein